MMEQKPNENEAACGPSALSVGLDGEYGAKALEILLALAKAVAEGKSFTIAPDWGLGSATLVDETGAHTHIGDDACDDNEEKALVVFVDGVHGMLVSKRGLSWAKPSNVEVSSGALADDETEDGWSPSA